MAVTFSTTADHHNNITEKPLKHVLSIIHPRSQTDISLIKVL